MTTEIYKRRVDYIGWIGAHTVPGVTDYQGSLFDPNKMIVEVFVDQDKARVKVIGNLYQRSTDHRSAIFNITGYTSYRPCPSWMIPIIRHLGYGGHIEQEATT